MIEEFHRCTYCQNCTFIGDRGYGCAEALKTARNAGIPAAPFMYKGKAVLPIVLCDAHGVECGALCEEFVLMSHADMVKTHGTDVADAAHEDGVPNADV